ncbi:TIGR03862 family flavoprotein [Alsobacter sp. KACC 23698]|uniref:TIGR03862 family flavoprotein n=1 Tax=Alsobacter sp. KACC 23698 TaxID=3149229 RepID=A0AAU7JAV6_9HYPH
MTETQIAAAPPTPLHVAIVGGGPAGLMAAETIATGAAGRVVVTVYDHMPSLGRKFLLAGRGGLNLTHGEPMDAFAERYREAAPHLRPMLDAFPPDALRAWADALGQHTFVGSSGRVFPKAMKASPLLRAWLRRLDGLGVRVALRHRWTGWDEAGRLRFEGPDGVVAVAADATVLALGGASWPKLGSDGGWTGLLAAKDVAIAPLRAANSGFDVAWTDLFRERFQGEPLKGAAFTVGRRRLKGEAVISRHGIEGGAVYALSAELRAEIEARGEAALWLDLRPDVRAEQLAERAAAMKPGQSMANVLRKAMGVSPVGAGLLREAFGPDLPREPLKLAQAVKGCRLRITGVRPLDRAISTAGGVAFEEVDEALMLKRLPGVFVAGEMLDWEAPTGGYLLQACFSSGVAAGQGALQRLGQAG